MTRMIFVVASLAAVVLGCASRRDAASKGEATREVAAEDRRHVRQGPSATAAAPSTRGLAGGTESESEAVKLLELLLGRTKLYSSAADSAATRFHFLTRVTHTGERGKRVTVEFAVERDEHELTVLCLAGNGLPYAYMRGGLFVAIDPLRPGGLLVSGGGAPTFLLRADEVTYRFNFAASYASRQANPYVLLDLPSLLRSTMANLRDAKLDGDQRAVHVITRDSAITIFMGGEGDAVPVKSFMSTSKTGAAIHVTQIGLGAAPWSAYLSERRLLASGLPLRRARADEEGSNLLLPPDLRSNAGLQLAAEKLQQLLLGELPEPQEKRSPRLPTI